MKPGQFSSAALVVALATLGSIGCATPSERFDRRAGELGLVGETLPGSPFDHGAYRSRGRGRLLHIYLEGDASPRMASRYSPPDPTPHRPVALELMALDPGPSILLGRPCQHGRHPNCDPVLWTTGRYGENVVQSLVAALRYEITAEGSPGIVLIGHSGGGALAMLIAERLPETRAVITIAGNLDTRHWWTHHGYAPLTESLDPAQQPPLDPAIVQFHLVGEADQRVPPALTRESIDRQAGAITRRYPGFDHSCCWALIWPDVLAELSTALGAPRPGR